MTTNVGQVSSLLHPRGPKPGWVYWVRRLVLLLVIMAIVVGVGVVVKGRLAKGTSTSTNSAVAEPATTSAAEATASGAPAQPTGAPIECIDDAISVEVAPDAKKY